MSSICQEGKLGTTRNGRAGWGCARELITTEKSTQRVRTCIWPSSLHFHGVQFRFASEKHAFFRFSMRQPEPHGITHDSVSFMRHGVRWY